MNLVGKIFTVLIFIISLVLMSLVLALYATHTNWRLLVENPPEKASPQNPEGYKFRLQDAETIKQNLQDRIRDIQSKLDREVTEKKQVKAKLEAENVALAEANAKLDAELKKYKDEEAATVTSIKGVMETLDSMRTENSKLREEVKKLSEDRDTQFDLMVKKTDELHDKANEYQILYMRNKELAAEYARAQEVLRHFGLQNDPEYYASNSAPEFLSGRVLKVSPDLVVISLGADSGVRKGHQFDVSRASGGAGAIYVGRIEVVRADQPDQAVCKILKEQQQNQFQENDRVVPKR